MIGRRAAELRSMAAVAAVALAPALGACAGGGAGAGAGVASRPSDAGPAAAPDAGAGGGAPLLLPSAVVISEIMYHPVAEQTDDELHEFVELANRSGADVDLSGWRLQSTRGHMSFTFAPGARLAAGAYAVVARQRAALEAAWGAVGGPAFGDYTGALDNGGDTVLLADAALTTVDAVAYDDAPPWPISADALGGGEEWQPEADRPLSKHAFKGRSLERLSLDAPPADPASWEASALDGATPGRPNGAARAAHPVAAVLAWAPRGGAGHLIRATDEVEIAVTFTPGEVAAPELRFFADDVARTGEPVARAPLVWQAAAARWTAALPAQPDGTLVRYQVWATRDGALEQVSPRATDPVGWHAYFVSPRIDTRSRVYQLFVPPETWTKLEAALPGARTSGCAINPAWEADYPATFVFDGEVYDVLVGYSGSNYQRRNGAPIAAWPYPGPTLPRGRKFSALSWKVKFPGWRPFEDGQRTIKLNKLRQGFPGVNSWVESQLLQRAGLPSYGVGFARLHINGGYYHYVAQMEAIDDRLLARWAPGAPLGDLFKDDGGGDEGPYARGDFRPLGVNPACRSIPVQERYAATYARETFDYRGPQMIIDLITGLDAAVAGGVVSAAARQYFLDNWDVAALANTFAVRNWCGAWDDTLHNVFPYRRADGKWILVQQDFEWDLGVGRFGDQPELAPFRADETFYIGGYSGGPVGQTCELPASVPERASCNGTGFSRLKDVFIQNFRAELDAALRALSTTVLAPDAVAALVDQGAAMFEQADWDASPAAKTFCGPNGDQPCVFADQVAAMKQWARDRHAALAARLPP